MSDQTHNQDLAMEAFQKAFSEQNKSDEWTALKSASVALATLDAIVDAEGTRIEFTEVEKAAFKCAFYHTVDARLGAIGVVLEKRGVKVPNDLLELLKDLFIPQTITNQIKAAKEAPKVSLKDLIKRK